MPFGTASARAAFYSLLKDKGSGIDANGNPFKWDQYVSRNISVLPDQPVMRSGFNPAYADNVWPIPTVFVVNSRFFFKKRKNNEKGLPSLREVYDEYRGICAFCWSKIKFCDASREHIHSKAFGGSNGEENIALACKSCNSNAGSAMPKRDVHGNEIVGRVKIRPSHFVLNPNVTARPEWAPYLFTA